MRKMEEIAYWIRTKRAPCLYEVDMNNKKQSDAHCSRSKETSPCRDGISSCKNKKKRKLSIFDESESEHNEKNVYFNEGAQAAAETLLSSCKDSIISKTELKAKKPPSKAQRLGRPTLKATTGKQNVRSVGKTPNNDSSLESGLFSGETKNKQSSLSKSLSKKSAEKYAIGESTPIKKCGGKVVNGLYDDMSDVSGFTASYIRSTKKSAHHLSKSKKDKKQLIKESQDKIYVNKHVETAREPMYYSSGSSNIINVVTCSNQQTNGKLDKETSLLKFVTPTSQHTPRLRPRKKVSTPVPSRYFTRSKATSFEDLSGFSIDNTSTPMKSDIERVRRVNDGSTTPSRASGRRVCGSKQSSHSSQKRVSAGRQSCQSNHKRVSHVVSASSVNARDKSGFSACFSDSETEQPDKRGTFFD